jgi:V/A-type H+-transporting ATPase subunit E
MQSKLQELTDKIYQEGLDKGNKEAAEIVDNAKKEANDILEQAREEAKKIIEDAEKQASETTQNAKSEVKLSVSQSVNTLKQEIADLINGKIIDTDIKKSFDDEKFVKDILVTSVKNWNPNEEMDLAVLLPESKEGEMKDYFSGKAKDILDKKVEFKTNPNLKSGFEIGPADGSYKISFTDEVFENFLKVYFRPRLIELLYGKD